MTLQRKKSVHIFTGVQAGTLQQRALITKFFHIFVVTPILTLLSTPRISFLQTDFSQHVLFICLFFNQCPTVVNHESFQTYNERMPDDCLTRGM